MPMTQVAPHIAVHELYIHIGSLYGMHELTCRRNDRWRHCTIGVAMSVVSVDLCTVHLYCMLCDRLRYPTRCCLSVLLSLGTSFVCYCL